MSWVDIVDAAKRDEENKTFGMMTRVVIAALRKLECGWCQRYNATNRAGDPVKTNSPTAARFDIWGAIVTSNRTLYPDKDMVSDIIRVFKEANGLHGYQEVSGWNDDKHRRKNDVLLAMYKTLEYIESKKHAHY